MKINWTLSVNEANAVLAVLGKLPYEQVSALISSLQEQTKRSVELANLPPPPPPPPDTPA
jgi:predicted Zn-dependent peptidase